MVQPNTTWSGIVCLSVEGTTDFAELTYMCRAFSLTPEFTEPGSESYCTSQSPSPLFITLCINYVCVCVCVCVRSPVCTACILNILRRRMTHSRDKRRKGLGERMDGKEWGERGRKKRREEGDGKGRRRANFLRRPACNDLSFVSRRRSLSLLSP